MSMDILVTHSHIIIADNKKEAIVKCSKGKCDTISIFYIPYLDYESYNILIIHKAPILADEVELSLSCIDPNFSKYQLITKYVFFILALVSYTQFIISSRRILFKL